MSDLGDMADGIADVVDRGATFARAGWVGVATPSREPLPKCSCGGKSAYAPHPPLTRGGKLVEVLACPCGNFVGPFSSRQALAAAWRMGGWESH